MKHKVTSFIVGFFLLALIFGQNTTIPPVLLDAPNSITSDPGIFGYDVPEMKYLDDNSKILQAFPETSSSSTITSISNLNNTQEPVFIARMENGNFYNLNASELNTYAETQYPNLWGVGIRTKYGIVAFYTNDNDATWGHTQLVSYPVLANGSLPPLGKPIMGTFLRLWANAGGTWYRNFITSQPLFQSNGVDPRRWMNAVSTPEYLELGWNATLEIQGFDFDLYVGIRLNLNDSNLIHIKTNITSLDRSWNGLGLEYVLAQSSFYDGTPNQIMYGTVSNDTFEETFPLSQFRDMTVEIPSRFNKTTLSTQEGTVVHEFDWDDMRSAGFDTSLFRIENMELPNGEYDWVIRTGMYGIKTIPQGYTVEIDPTVTVTSDGTRAMPMAVARDSNYIPYVLAINGTTLGIWKGNEENPSSWSWEQVGDGNVYSESVNRAYMIIYSYSGTEYIGVIRANDDQDSVFDRSTVSAFSFPSGSTISVDVGSNAYVSLAYGNNTLVHGYRYSNTRGMEVTNSTDGGSTWGTPVIVWNDSPSGPYTRSTGVTYDGSYWHLFNGRDRELYAKRWSVAGGYEYWDGDSWEPATATTAGYGSLANFFGDLGLHASSSANIIIVGHGTYGTDDSNMVYSRDGGQTWTTVSGMGNNAMAGMPSLTLMANDSFLAYATDYEAGALDDFYTNYYNYTADAQGGWNLLTSGATSDTILNSVGLPVQVGGWVDVAYQWYDSTETTYFLNFTIIEVGDEAGGADVTDPTFSYVGTTNSSSVEYGTSIIGNWSITEANPSTFIIYSNTTGSNVSKTSGSFNNGDYKNWTFANDNSSLIGSTIFIEIWANDTSSNSANSIVYFTIVDTTDPVLSYVGTTNNSQIDYLTSITGNWSITELFPNTFNIYSNTTGSNVSKSSGSYNSGDYKTWTFDNDNISLVGSTIFIEIWATDDNSNYASSIVFFTISEAINPTYSYVGTTNSSTIELGTSITGNWSITDTSASNYIIYANNTGVNASKASGSYNSGDYKTWTFNNDNISLVDLTFYIQIWSNDTWGNSASSIVFFTIEDTTDPVFSYVGSTNNSQIDYLTSITGNWSITDLAPGIFDIYSNTIGVNVSKTSGSFNSGDYKSWTFNNDNISLVGSTIFIEIWANDTSGNLVSSIVYFTVSEAIKPTFSYTGSTNESTIELNTSILGNWSITDISASNYFIFSNTTGINATKASGSYNSGDYKTWTFDNDNSSLVGLTFYIQIWANDTYGNTNSSIVYFTIEDTTNPSVVYGGTTNGTEIDIGTSITGSWDLTELAPSYYFIYSNTTGSNVSKASGSYLDGDTKSWIFANDNCSLGSGTIYIQIWLNDTTGNVITSIVYFDIINDAPQLTYTGTANSSVLEWESGGAFTASWTVSEDSPHLYFLFWNQTGSNTTWQSGTYTSSVSKAYDPTLSDVGNTIWIQLVLNDTCGESATETYFFSVTNTDAPTVTINTPANTTYISQQIEIWISSSNGDLDVLWWSLFYNNGTLYEGNVTWTETVTRTLVDGTYYLTAFANDTASLEGSTTTYFTMAESVLVEGGQGTQNTDGIDDPNNPNRIGRLGSVNNLGTNLFIVGLFLGLLYVIYWLFYKQKPDEDENYERSRRIMNKKLDRVRNKLKGTPTYFR